MLWGIDANSEVGTVGPARLFVVRIIAVLVVSFGCAYIFWRWSDTIAWSAWWIAIPLVIAETYSLSESILFAFMMWNARERPVPPAARPGLTVDVFITTYNEPLELVVRTAIGAREVRYPHNTWILDDGDREEFGQRLPRWASDTSHEARSGTGVSDMPRPATSTMRCF